MTRTLQHQDKTREQLVHELAALEERARELEKLNADLGRGVQGQRETLKDLSHNTEILETVFQNFHFLVAYMDRDCNFLRVNRVYAEAAGKTPEFFPGKNHFDLYPHKENESIFNEVLETGRPYTACRKSFEYPGDPDRGVTYWDWSLHPVRGIDGEMQGVLLCLVDATPEEMTKRQLRRYAVDSISMRCLQVAQAAGWVFPA